MSKDIAIKIRLDGRDVAAAQVAARRAERQSRWLDWLFRRMAMSQPCHDEPAPGAWLCGECPYMNVGSLCTKCGAPRWKGTAFA